MKSQIRFGSLLLILSLAVLLAACSGASAPGVAEPPAGWEKFEGDGFEIYLPESFEGGSSQPDLAAAAQLMRDAGNEQLAMAMESSNYLLYVVDSESIESGTTVNILKEVNPVIANMSTSGYADAATSQLAGITGITITESAAFTVSGYDAWRLVEEFDLAVLAGAEGTSKLVQYLLKTGDTVWILTYGTLISEFDSFEPTFEQSLRTFREK